MRLLFTHFPRQVACPERYPIGSGFKDMKLLLEYANKINGIMPKVYFSIYDCDLQGHFDNCHVDKIAFDLDSDKAFENIKRSHYKLMQKDLMHLMIFSTGGFWLYVFNKNYENLVYRKGALLNSIKDLSEMLQLSMELKDSDKDDIDFHCTDLQRVSRLPGSYDVHRKLYCIPISEEDLEKGFDWIKSKAQTPCNEYVYYGTKYYDISLMDKPADGFNEFRGIVLPDSKIDIEVTDELIKDFLPSVRRILLVPGADTWKNRYYFAVYCADEAIRPTVCDAIAKKYFSKTVNKGSLKSKGTNYDHFRKNKIIEHAYRRSDYYPITNEDKIWMKKTKNSHYWEPQTETTFEM